MVPVSGGTCFRWLSGLEPTWGWLAGWLGGSLMFGGQRRSAASGNRRSAASGDRRLAVGGRRSVVGGWRTAAVGGPRSADGGWRSVVGGRLTAGGPIKRLPFYLATFDIRIWLDMLLPGTLLIYLIWQAWYVYEMPLSPPHTTGYFVRTQTGYSQKS